MSEVICDPEPLEVDGLKLMTGHFRGNRVMLSFEPQGWHMSISHPDHYPSWDDIRDARYDMLPNNLTMAMLLPPKEEFVNVHKNCFHLFELRE